MYGKTFNTLFHFLETQSPLFHAVLCVLFAGLVIFFDYVTGDYMFVLFYVIPLFLANWFLSRTFGIAISVFFCVTLFWLNYEFMTHSDSILHMGWDFTLNLLLFLFLGFLIRMLCQKYAEISSLALKDSLTQALNRRSLKELAEYELSLAIRYNRPFSVAFFDLDNFKEVNDRCGHDTGDLLLQRVVIVMEEMLRSADLIARLGGDEFVVALPETDSREAVYVLEKLHKGLKKAMQEEGWPVTFSIGAVTCSGADCSWADILHKADQLMYQVKSTSKNGLLHEELFVSRPQENAAES